MSDNVLMAALQAAFTQAVQTAVSTHVTELATKVAALETKLGATVQLDKAQTIDALDQQEWFWGKLKGFIDENTPANIDLEKLSEQLREMVRAEMADTESKILAATGAQLADIADRVDLEQLAKHIDVSTLAGELTDSQLNDIANEIDLDDLAGELDAQGIADKIDVEEAVRDFFQNNTFSIRP